ncbi:MAG: hypothetical protein WAK16_04140 [Candidatus Cybelea sp.]
MKPGTSGQDLLYTAGGENGRGIVYVYTYPQGALVGTLTGMIQPSGVCTDSAGNVFIVAYTTGSLGSSTIYKYAHGGTSPVAMLSDPGVALGCAVDPKTGNLAVANTSDFTNPYEDDWGDIAIYPEARGNPKIYYDDGFPAFYNCGYDNEGNLYVSAFPYNGLDYEAVLVRLARGRKALEEINLDVSLWGNLPVVPSVQWDGQYIAVSSFPGQFFVTKILVVYRLKISGSSGTAVDELKLRSRRSHAAAGQVWIEGRTLVGVEDSPDFSNVSYWRYPRGGKPTYTIRDIVYRGTAMLFGVAISPATSR